jgi:hypothetical protein
MDVEKYLQNMFTLTFLIEDLIGALIMMRYKKLMVGAEQKKKLLNT